MKQSKSKKSTTKNRKFKISPLIPIIAIIEVIVLVVISSYAWFFFRASKVIGSGTISVAADSGLDIDFQYSNVDDYINIWNYVPDDFRFEPASSLDGRNIYFPTSGTFDKDNTKEIVFRDGTVNDINSKYLSIDFELTNTSEYTQYVYLNNNSYFTVKDSEDENIRQESRALRLAFYQNDGNSGNVGSSLLQSGSASDGGSSEDDSESASQNAYTIYFNNESANWGNVYAYLWDSDGGSNPEYITAWPGTQMSRVSGKVYAITVDNPVSSGTSVKYDKLIFTNNSGTQTGTINLTTAQKGFLFDKNSSGSNQGALYSENTVYFLKPSTWTGDDVYCHTWHSTGSSAQSYTTWPGDKMTYVGSGIYSYSYNSSNTGGFLFDNGNQDGTNQTNDLSVKVNNVDVAAGSLYYCTGSLSGGHYAARRYTASSYANLQYKTIYLFNTFGWSKPYATVSMTNTAADPVENSSITNTEIAMVALSGNMYYCTVPQNFTNVYFHEKKDNVTTIAANDKTISAGIEDQQVYRPQEAMSGNLGHTFGKFFYYSKYIKEEGYPVISPGVSAGFQRPYSPIITIDAFDGLAQDVVPAYSNSIDNYILGSGTPLFTLEKDHMASLSMIMWLEGTDDAASGSLYPGNTIDFKLEFSTVYYPDGTDHDPEIVNPGDSASYTYNFYDRTRELWTSDRQSTESGVTVAPVMQLYDNTIKRGYLMKPSAYGSYDGKRKVSCWTVDAPQSIVKYGHDIIFRRVNPYNEDEVWNYWHAGPVAGDGNVITSGNGSPYDIAFSGGNTISFTAFSDGSPTDENLEAGKKKENPSISAADMTTYIANAAVPTDSCGGLWGNHNINTLTVLDGTSDHFIANYDGILTMKYSFEYKVNNNISRTVTIEYKSSDEASVYYFIVPEALYKTAHSVTFKRYYNFNRKYAINSDRNEKILYDRKWDASTATGLYYEISQKTNGNALEDNAYWGSDLLYVQTNATTYSELWTDIASNKNRMLQVYFYQNSNSNNNFYSVLFPNSNYKGSDANSQGFPVVIPNGKAYDRYQVQWCYANGGTKIYKSNNQTLYSDTVPSGYTQIPRIVTAYKVSTHTSENICVLDYYENIRIYFESNYNSFWNSSDQKYYIYNSRGWKNAEFPGQQMTYDEDTNYGYKRFYFTVDVTNYRDFKCSWWYSGTNSRWEAPDMSFTPMDNYAIFQCYEDGTTHKMVCRRNGNYDVPSGVDRQQVIHSYTAPANDWAHYSAKQGS